MDFLENIPDKIMAKLDKANLGLPQQVLSTPNPVLQKHGFTSDDIKFLRGLAAKSLCPEFKTVHDVINTQVSKWNQILFGCDPIDACTGGVSTRGITEIFGESGSGKTQLLLQLSLMVQLPPHHGGLGRGAVFINTEKRFPWKRLHQLAQHFNKIFPETKCSDNIFIGHCFDEEAFTSFTTSRLSTLMKRNNFGLIVIDSIAGIYRLEENVIIRANKMRKLADNLLHLIDDYNCAVVCANQVIFVRKYFPRGLLWKMLQDLYTNFESNALNHIYELALRPYNGIESELYPSFTGYSECELWHQYSQLGTSLVKFSSHKVKNLQNRKTVSLQTYRSKCSCTKIGNPAL